MGWGGKRWKAGEGGIFLFLSLGVYIISLFGRLPTNESTVYVGGFLAVF